MEGNNKKERRYYIVYFSGINQEGDLQRGKVHMSIDNGGFVNEEYIHRIVEKDFNLTKIYVSNIVELNESDFSDFIAPYISEDDELNENNKETNNKTNLNDFI